MALKATIFKAEVSITDMDRNYYNDHHLTIARHPSENDERMMLRLVAFIANANEHLQFTRGLSEDHEPDLWQKSFSDDDKFDPLFDPIRFLEEPNLDDLVEIVTRLKIVFVFSNAN